MQTTPALVRARCRCPANKKQACLFKSLTNCGQAFLLNLPVALAHQIMKQSLILLLLLFSSVARAQDSLRLIHSIQTETRMITMDELGNTYAVKNDNTLIRYNNFGDSTGFYRSVLNGEIGLVDATNPLRILLYYPAFYKAVLLDRMLTQKAEIDLSRKQITSATAIALASDGNLWVYDPFRAQLMKLNEQGEIIRSSNDLRQELSFVPNITFLLERDRRVYACDTTKGIVLFDQFATYTSTLPLTGANAFQAFDQQIVYRQGSTMHSYDMKLFGEKTFPLPHPEDSILDAVIGQDRLAVLYKRRLALYQWPPQSGTNKH